MYQALLAGSDKGISAEQLERVFFGQNDAMGYYDFLETIGTDSILWPN